ncbi:A24 family peptidase [Neisseria leonii]|uniref:prepilin peptidase n=1 Tax=Neisseria leonii TaxID=2995413 RepID=UPI0030D56608
MMTVWAALAGLLAGSFLSVAVYRLPLMMARQWDGFARERLGWAQEQMPRFDLAWPSSHCPHCQGRLKTVHNLPLIGFLLQKGRCAQCGSAIGLMYPALELAAAAAFAASVSVYGAGYVGMAGMVLAAFLLASAWIDARTRLLPDILTLPLLWLGLLFHAGGGFVPLQQAVWGAAAGYLALWLLNAVYRLLRGQDGMGGGDMKLLAALGAWLGVEMLLPVVFLSALFGLLTACVYGRGRREIPFGPSLAAAGWLVFLAYAPVARTLPLWWGVGI